MASKSAIRAPIAKIRTALASGSKLQPAVQEIRVVAGRPHRQLLKQHLPALSYANPSIEFAVDYLPSPRPKTKDPKILERNAALAQRIEAAQQGAAEGDRKKGVDVISEVVVRFRDGPPQTISLNGISSADALKRLRETAAVEGSSGLAGSPAAPSNNSPPSAAANESEGAAAASSVSDGAAAAA